MEFLWCCQQWKEIKPHTKQVNISFSLSHSYLGLAVEIDCGQGGSGDSVQFSNKLKKNCHSVMVLVGSKWPGWNFTALHYPLSKFSNTMSLLTGGL